MFLAAANFTLFYCSDFLQSLVILFVVPTPVDLNLSIFNLFIYYSVHCFIYHFLYACYHSKGIYPLSTLNLSFLSGLYYKQYIFQECNVGFRQLCFLYILSPPAISS
ncbi:hypothetical protein O5D80_006531 [Batrachochytrium dendrobatidis]|nr:hypothetical protein O5D80_006531 [Batrachochytrium dendrobatidis]